MSMDASKFSLEQAMAIIVPHLEHLSFKLIKRLKISFVVWISVSNFGVVMF